MKVNKWIVSFLSMVVLVQIAACQDTKVPQSTTPKPSAVAVRDTFWIDVRTPGEFEDGHLVEATNIPLQVLESEFQARVPDKNAVIALYCRSGNRSGQALRIVQGWGYTKAFNAGGFSALSESRSP